MVGLLQKLVAWAAATGVATSMQYCSSNVSCCGWTYVGALAHEVPAYAFLIDATGDGELDLVVASFAAFEAGSVSLISNASSIKTALASGTAAPATVVLTTDLFWPNWIEIAPAGMFGASPTLVVADGFLLPGSSPGMVLAIEMEGGRARETHSLTGSTWNPLNFGSFYGTFEFQSLGSSQDLLATRVHARFFSENKASLVWLRRPLDGDPDEQSAWERTELFPDVDFAFVSRPFRNGSALAVFAGSFCKSTLHLLSIDTSAYPPTLLRSVLVDDQLGPVYSTQLFDLDADGIDELVVTDHSSDAQQAALYAFALPSNDPDDWFAEANMLERHTLASGFAVLNPGTGKAAPGFPVPYWRDLSTRDTEPPRLLLQGDDAGAIYALTFNSRFNYSVTQMRVFGDRVGLPAIADVDADGRVEMFVPDYANNLVHLYVLGD